MKIKTEEGREGGREQRKPQEESFSNQGGHQ